MRWRMMLVGLACVGCAGSGSGERSAESNPATRIADSTTMAFEATTSKEWAARSAPARWLRTSKDLPVGFTYVKGTPIAHESYPTADDPNAVLGRIRLRLPELITEEDEEELEKLNNFQRGTAYMKLQRERLSGVRPKVARFAADHGANTVLWSEKDVVWALYVSPQEPAPGPEASQILTQVAAPGFREAERQTLSLGATDPGALELLVERGRCYGIAFAMTPTARRERNLGWGVSWRATRPQGSGDLRSIETVGAVFPDDLDGISSRGHFNELFCPLVTEKVTFTVYPSAHSDKSRPVGHGDAVVALMQRPAKPGEVIRKSCDACAPHNTGCAKTMTHSGCEPAVRCLAALKMSPAQCQN